MKGLFDKIGQIYTWITDTYNQVISQIDVLLNLKSIIEKDFTELIDELKSLTAQQQDFAQRVKTLKTRLIRADVIFEFIDEIRTGELRSFCVDQLGSLQSNLSQTIADVSGTLQQVGAVGSKANVIVRWIQKVVLVWGVIGVAVDTLKGIVPVVQAFKDKLAQFESVILQQGNPRIRLKGTISAREGKLHG